MATPENALVFLLPVVGLWFISTQHPLPGIWNVVAKIATFRLAALGSIFLGWLATELPKAFARKTAESAKDPQDRPARQVRSARCALLSISA